MNVRVGRRPWRRWFLLAYVVLLGVHHLLAARPRPLPAPAADEQVLSTPPRRDTQVVEGASVRVAYVDTGPRSSTALLLLHGSPGSGHDFDQLRTRLPADLRVVSLDLPGFSHSSADVPDYSFRAHAAYVAAMLDSLRIERAHVVGFSMGGGVAIEMLRQDPRRVASLVLLAGLGVQEFELLGNYEINHAIHGAQLVGLWALTHLVPHFGVFDDVVLGLSYARNFYDSDQRPLRPVLESYQGPMLVMHGVDDFLVPVEAAREHLRIVPQARERIFEDGSHFLVWTHPTEVAQTLVEWIAEVEAGRAPLRSDALAERIAAAAVPLEEVRDLRATGFTRALLLFLLVLGTFITEDITSIGAGLLIAQGRLGLVEAFGAVFLGIYFGDLLLYVAGRLLGTAVLRRAPLKWVIDEEDLRRGARWFERRGFWAIMLSRFVPGTRLPTYVAAGVVRAGFLRFALYFLVAVVLWTPLLVGFAALVGQKALEHFDEFRHDSLWFFLILLALLALVLRVGLPLLRWRGRRLALAWWRRLRRWEYWPSWIVYAPVLVHALRIAPRYGGFWTPTAVNPGMPASGVVGESKTQILTALGTDHPHVARFVALPTSLEPVERLQRVERFLDANALDLPVVLKPDAGQRGEGVRIVRDRAVLAQLIESQRVDLLAQEYVPGLEFGVFYAREDESQRGRIISITHKQPLVIEGDGVHTLEQLVLRDDRSLALAPAHLRRHEDHLDHVLAAGERYVVAELGTHARGSIFVDAGELRTDALEQAVDELSRRFDGFRFGRYDIRVPSREHFVRGEGLKVIELNGLTSECTHIYDARYGRRDAVAVLKAQWELAYRIGADQVRRGHPRSGPLQILRAWWAHRRRRRFHAEDRISVPLPRSSE